MRKEYDLRNARPATYWKRISPEGREVLLQQFLGACHLVRLDDDVAKAFPDEASVNEALRLLLQLRALASAKGKAPTPRTAKPRARARKRKAA